MLSKKDRKEAVNDFFKNKMKRGKGTWYLLPTDELEAAGFKYFKAPAGKNFLTILPRPEDPKFMEEIFVHYDVGQEKAAFLCPRKMWDDPCPICEYAEELKRAGEAEEIYSRFWSNRRFLFWIVNAKDKRTIAEGVYLYDAPYTVLNGISSVSRDPRTDEIIDVSDPDEGLNIVFIREGADFKTKYSGFMLERRPDVIPKEFYDTLPDMKDVLIIPDIQNMKKALGTKEETSRAEREYTEQETGHKPETVRFSRSTYGVGTQEVTGRDSELEQKKKMPWEVTERETFSSQQENAPIEVEKARSNVLSTLNRRRIRPEGGEI